MSTYVVRLWGAVFSGLSWISPLKLLRATFPTIRRSDGFTDSWAIGNSLLAFVAVIGWTWLPSQFAAIVLIWAMLRLFEMMVYQVNLLLFDPVRPGRRVVRGYRRLLLLGMHNYVEVVSWFAVVYRFLSAEFLATQLPVDTAIGSLYFSFVVITTVGFGDTLASSGLGAMAVSAELLIGLFLALILFARLVALLPVPRSLDPDEMPEPEEIPEVDASGA